MWIGGQKVSDLREAVVLQCLHSTDNSRMDSRSIEWTNCKFPNIYIIDGYKI